STHYPEEKYIIEALKEIQEDIDIFIAPRNFNHNHKIIGIAEKTGRKTGRWSEGARDGIVLVDEYGVLSDLYRSADLAYVGGGFIKTGLHNILEPLTENIPVICGPEGRNFSEDLDFFAELGCVCICSDMQHIVKSISYLYTHRDKLKNMRSELERLSGSNKGTADRIHRYLEWNIYG
ncbi:MAG: 3-deoxy-D-manno-octulosonic acid transferase, partial [Candidatus Muiribacteriaceae bacterium]